MDTYSTYIKRPVEYTEGQRFTGALPDDAGAACCSRARLINRRLPEEGYGAVQAFDPKTGEQEVGVQDDRRHRQRRADHGVRSAVLPAAAKATSSRSTRATGALLWKASVGGAGLGGADDRTPSDGRQYVAIAAGSALFVYALRQ